MSLDFETNEAILEKLGTINNFSQETFKIAWSILLVGDFQQRWEVSKFLPKFGEEAIAPLLSIWENEAEDLELRWFVGRILGDFPQASVRLSLIKILQESEEEDLLKIATESLAKLGQEAIANLTQLLQKNDEETRKLAIKALGQIRNLDTVTPLVAVVNDENADIRRLAIEVLGSFHGEAITEILLQSLEDKAAQVRKEAVIALGFRYPKEITTEIVSKITPLLYDFHPEVCQETALTLGRIATKESVEALFPVLKSPGTPTWLQIAIVRALGWCETEQAIAYLGEALQWLDTQACEEIVSILGKQVKNELKQQANNILINYVSSYNLSLQVTAIRKKIAASLSNLKQKNALNSLELLSKDSDKTVQLHAIYGLKQLTVNN
jgi:HEAT repeat protein